MSDNAADTLRFFWGKARPDLESGGSHDSQMHPLIAHMLDVAAVAILLPGSERLGLDRRQLGFLVALHDLGKVAPAFQSKVEACWPEAAFGPFPHEILGSRHDADGLALLDNCCEEALAPLFGVNADGDEWVTSEKTHLWRSIAGHHGQPVEYNEFSGGAAVVVYARELVGLLFDVFRPPPIACLSEERLLQLEWRLAGLTVQADWLGSQQGWFPYVSPAEVADAAGYFWNRALPQAQTAIARAGLAPVNVSPFRGIRTLFPHVSTPSPVQALMESVALPAGPTLVIIEDMTGSGKTEAALVAAHRLMADDHASGLFVALPTMATANAMYDRLVVAYRSLFQPSSRPSLALAHGRAALDERFVAAVAPDDALDAASLAEGRAEAAEASCSAWLGSESRRALMAQVGVGTIDQALMAVLPVRFATVRQAGLAGKILLVDECHAYDPYMQEEMIALLRFHAAMGGSAILLSATLTGAVRQKLTDAFRQGLHQTQTTPLSSTAYPLVTMASVGAVEELPSAPRPGLERVIAVRRLDDEAAAMETIARAAAVGAAIAWVRNTVDDVIASAKALKAAGVDATVFHARFAMVDRLKIENDVLSRFGKESDTGRSSVLIASQVIEQSLDLDFDVLCTDLAPMDLIIQRAGRLRRHKRSGRPVDRDEICVVSPEPVDNPGSDWIRSSLPGTASVYRDPALLWRTAKVLARHGKIRSPESIRALIEEAGDSGNTPEGLMSASTDAEGHGKAKRDTARRNVLHYTQGYTPDGALWDREIRTPTRLEEREQVTLRLCVMRDGVVLPWSALHDSALAAFRCRRKAWALSEVSLARHHIKECRIPAEAREAVAAARAGWSRWEREAEERVLVLLLEQTEAGWEGHGRNDAGQDVVIGYDGKYGLQVFPLERM